MVVASVLQIRQALLDWGGPLMLVGLSIESFREYLTKILSMVF